MKYAKAVVAAGVAGLGALGSAMLDDHVTYAEWLFVLGAVVAALGAVARVPNKDA